MIFDLAGRTALVTGAGQGIGAGIARHLAGQGARLLVNDVVGERAELVASELSASGVSAQALPFDVTDQQAVAEALQGQSIDILVCNAGNAGARPMEPRPFREMEPADWHAAIDVNLHGVLNTVHAVIPGMHARGFGRVIVISSGAGVMGLPIGVSTYGAGKGGALSFMRHLAIENAGTGVTANALALGLMEMESIQDSELVEMLARSIPMGRLGTGDDVGPAVVWLASQESSWVTGQTIHLSGGSTTT